MGGHGGNEVVEFLDLASKLEVGGQLFQVPLGCTLALGGNL